MGKLKSILSKLVDNLYYKFHEDLPSLNEQLNEIMENFDFNKVVTFMEWNKSYRVYDDYGNCIKEEQWKLSNKRGYVVPTESELRSLAKSLLEEVIKLYKSNDPDNQFIWVGTGPFKVVCRFGILELMCVIAYWSYD